MAPALFTSLQTVSSREHYQKLRLLLLAWRYRHHTPGMILPQSMQCTRLSHGVAQNLNLVELFLEVIASVVVLK